MLVSLIALAFVAYRNCFDVFIPGDNYCFLYMFEKWDAAAILKNVREGAPYFVAYPILYLLYQLLGIDPAWWMVISITLHAANAFFVFLIAKCLLKKILNDQTAVVASFSALLFLVSPYQTESVLWTSINIRWLFHSLVTLAGIYFLLGYLENAGRKKIFAVHFLFLLGLFSYEFTMVCPLIYTVLFMLHRKLNTTGLRPEMFLTRIILPQIIFISGYFVACKLVSGHWLWHAGTIGDIIQTSDYSKTLLKYFAKFFIFYRYLPIGKTDQALRALSENSRLMTLSVIFAFAAIAFLSWRLIKTKGGSGYLLAALFACFIIALLPVLSLDSSFLKYIYPDRYGYLPSVFFYVFLVSALFFILKKIALPVLIGYSILCWVLLTQTIPVWNAVNERCNELIRNYKPFQQYERVYVLNVPAYYRGVAAFRSAFAETVYMKNSGSVENIRVISGCYQESDSDTIKSVTIKENTVTVSGPNKETPYFSANGGWAKSYETEEYKVVFSPDGCSYTLLFKQEIPTNSAFIYASLAAWKKAGN